LEAEAIKTCLEKDSNLWEQEANKLIGLNGSCINSVNLEEIKKLYHEKTKLIDTEKLVTLEDFSKVSSQIMEEQPLYIHSEYQACVAAVVTSKDSNATLVDMPTGSGKTWI
jgi:hypothetical protein